MKRNTAWILTSIFIVSFSIVNVSLTTMQNSPQHIQNKEVLNQETLPELADSFFEKRTDYTKQLINDSTIDQPDISSPWSENIDPESIDDLAANIGNSKLNTNLIGDSKIFSLNDSPINSSIETNWISTENPDFPAFPEWPDDNNPQTGGPFHDSYGIDGEGVWANHSWYESAKQTPSVNWVQNYSMPVNMTEYEITAVEISSLFNASCVADGTATSGNIEVAGDTNNAATQHVTYDYVYFYINVADLTRNTEYTLASYQTTQLGLSNATETISEIEGNLISVAEENLKFYLTSVLAVDNFNFSLIIGIDIKCEDSRLSDTDVWNMLRIKSLNFNFTYQKKIEQASAASWTQKGFKINQSSYEEHDIEVTAANLNFEYELDQPWIADSPNSEFKVIINNITHTETIKMTNATTSAQEVLGGSGFDVLDYIHPDENISIEIICYIADDFILDHNITISIDNIYLNVNYTVIERLPAVSTDITTDGELTRDIEWNTTFEVIINYTRTDSEEGIEGAELEVSWLLDNETVVISEIGMGEYKITASTENCTSNAQYPLQITASSEIPLQEAEFLIEIQVIGRSTSLDLWINDDEDLSLSPVYELPIGNPLNISALLFDNLTEIQDTTSNLTGSQFDSSMFLKEKIGNMHSYHLDTEKMGIGTHYLNLFVSKSNFQSQSIQLRIIIVERTTEMLFEIDGKAVSGEIDYQIQFNDSLTITVQYNDLETTDFIKNAQISVDGFQECCFSVEEYDDYYEIEANTSNLELGLHYITIGASLENYRSQLDYITLDIIPRATYLVFQLDEEEILTNSIIEMPISTNFTLKGQFYDNSTKNLISDASFSIQGISSDLLTISTTDSTYEIMFHTELIGFGFYPLSISASYPNHTTSIGTFELTIRQIQTRISTENENNSFTILPGSDIDLSIDIEDLDFNMTLTNCTVRYLWEFGSGEIVYNGSTYRILFEDIPEGIFPITISVYNGPNYDFDQFTIIINSIDPDADTFPRWIAYALGIGLVGVSISFVSYQKYFKYPKSIRKLNKVKRSIRIGRSSGKEFATFYDVFKDSYAEMIKEQGLLKSLPGSHKSKTPPSSFLTEADR